MTPQQLLAQAKAAAEKAAAEAKVTAERAAAKAKEEADRAKAALQRAGTRLGAGAQVRLPEMAVSFARGLVIQAWVRPDRLQDATLVELAQTAGVGRIALVCAQDRISALWHDADGVLWTASSKAGVLAAGVWTHVSLAIGAGGLAIWRGGVSVDVDAARGRRTTEATADGHKATPMPLEAARASNTIGGAFVGAVADVRLWNRGDVPEAIVARYGRKLRGDEVGLCGWWTLEGAAGCRDGSPFGRHGALVGGTWQAGASTFEQAAARDRQALDFGARGGKLELSSFTLTGEGFTWQAKVRVRDLERRCTLVRVQGPADMTISLNKGGLVCTLPGGKLQVAGVVRADTWVALAVRQAVDGTLTAYIDGAPVGAPIAATPLRAGEYTATVEPGCDGQMAELRLWSRGLRGAELADTAARRIHGWAPGLIGCWRMDDEQLTGSTLVNADPSGPVATVSDATMADRGDLSFGLAPAVAPIRVAGLDGAQSLTLPGLPRIGEGGLSVQLWLRPDRLTDATFLKLADEQTAGAKVQSVALSCTTGGDLTVAYTDTLYLQAPRVEGLLAARVWTHLSVTIATDGVMCVYRDGRLVAREEHDAPLVAALGSVVLGAGFAGCFAELRVWSRALTAIEVGHQWSRRVGAAGGLVGRWALAGDLSGEPGAGSGAPVWREAPALALTDGPTATAATVTARASLVADQSGPGKPDLVVDLTALDAAGHPLIGAALTVVVDRKIALFRGTSRGKEITISGEPLRKFTIATGAQGRVRLAMVADGLLAPVLRVRHAGMADGEWALVAPDECIHQALAGLTAQEAVGGRKATATTKAGARGLVGSDGDKLVKVLRGMLGAAAAFSFEAQSTAALAFGDDEAAPAAPLLAGPGGTFAIAGDAPLVRRLGAAPGQSGAAGPESFGVVDDVCSIVASAAKSAVSAALETVEAVAGGAATVARAVVESVTVRVDMWISGVQVAVSGVMTTVEQIVGAVVQVFTALKQSVAGVLEYLAELFDWTDILRTAEFMLAEVEGALTGAKARTVGVFKSLAGSIRTVESRVLTALQGSAAAPASLGEARAGSEQAGPPALPGPLDFLLALLPDDLERTIKDFRAIFDPVKGVFTGVGARLTGLVAGLDADWDSAEMKAARADPRRLLDGDVGDLRALARMVVRVAANLVVAAVDLAGDLAVALLASFERLLALHLQIPGLTEFVEKQVLGGRTLTVGLLLCLLPAIPVTAAYKAATGRSRGPADPVGPQSFAVAAVSSRERDLVLRGLDWAMCLASSIADGFDAVDEEEDDDSSAGVGDWLLWLADGTVSMIGFLSAEDEPDGGLQRDLDNIGWFIGMYGWIAGGLDLMKVPGADHVSAVAGALSGGVGVASGIVGMYGVCDDAGATKADVWVGALDLTAQVGEFVAGVAGAVPKQLCKDPVARGIRIGSIVGGHVVGVGAAAAAFTVVACSDAG